MHKKIMKKCSRQLEKDAAAYAKKAKNKKGPEKKHALIERKEALGAAKGLKKSAKQAHEFD